MGLRLHSGSPAAKDLGQGEHIKRGREAAMRRTGKLAPPQRLSPATDDKGLMEGRLFAVREERSSRCSRSARWGRRDAFSLSSQASPLDPRNCQVLEDRAAEAGGEGAPVKWEVPSYLQESLTISTLVTFRWPCSLASASTADLAFSLAPCISGCQTSPVTVTV